MSKVIEIDKLVERSPEICGNRPRICGTRITVGRIATLWKQGVTPEEMVDNWDYLTLAQVYAALAYYHANKEEIESILAADEAEYDRLEAEHNS
ncbi:MAG: DUF433 domain-containing protein [Cyanobacteriota bacterium]|nr:DUF433 domain-containing protein [Cyanobacteriota bacterium]